MFEWPKCKPVDMNSYDRKELFEHFCTFEIPVATRTIQIDVTKLKDYIDKNNYKFSLFMGFIIARANNRVQEFKYRIQDGKLVEYDKIIPAFTVLSADKKLYFSRGVYTDDFKNDYKENLEINRIAGLGQDKNVGSSNQGLVFITVNPWNSFTSLQFPYSSRFASVPVFSIGKMYTDNDRIKAPFAFQTHHGLIDGYHVGLFLDVLESHLENPELVTLT
jgi:chloramphenicol O-acetyltransferase type A